MSGCTLEHALDIQIDTDDPKIRTLANPRRTELYTATIDCVPLVWCHCFVWFHNLCH